LRRPRQHVTDDRGYTQLRAVFDSVGWTVNPIEHDYGIDYEIEVFRGGGTTGITFRAQLKSSEASPYSADRTFLSQPLTVPQARYLAEELHVPVILFHADVVASGTFWIAPQLDPDLKSRLRTRRSRSGDITIRIPTANRLPATLDALAQAVATAETVSAARIVTDTPIPDFVDAMDQQGPAQRSATLLGLLERAQALRVREAHRLVIERKLDEAAQLIAAVLGDPGASIEAKFSAILVDEMVQAERIGRAPGGDEPYHRMMLATAMRLRALTRRGPPHLKFYASIQKRAAELDWLIHRDWGMSLAIAGQPADADPIWLAQLRFRRAHLGRTINEKYRQSMRLISYASTYRYRASLVQPILRVGEALLPLRIRFRHEGQEEAAVRITTAVFEICKLVAAFAREAGDDESLVSIASAAAMAASADDGPENRWAIDLAQSIRSVDDRAAALSFIEKAARGRRGERDPRAKRADARQLYENMASALGVDITNPTDPVAAFLRIAIADADPTRVLRGCKHSIALLRGWNLPLAERMGLLTARPKAIVCLLHRYSREGLSLDAVFASFKGEFCDKCPDRTPHDANWEYADAWARAQYGRYLEGKPGSSDDEGEGGPRGSGNQGGPV
jgi:hypothetical protein